MIGVALKGLAGRKIRALLTAFAVVIGVSMVSGTFILTDTMQATFDGVFTASSAKTDAEIGGKEIVEGSLSGSGARIPESLLAEVRALPEVEAAGGEVSPQEVNAADVLGADGESVAPEGVGASYDAANPRFSPLALKTGKWSVGPKQVVIDAGTAAKEDLQVGDSVTVSTLGEKHRYELTGTASFGGVDSLGFASIAVWDVKTAQALLGRKGQFDGIAVAAKDGVSPSELVEAIEPILPGNLEVKDSAQAAKDAAAEVNSSMNMVRAFLLGFGVIALLVGAFVIFNTLSITVAQRTREFATLRTLGASRKQVMRSVRLEGLVIGLVASVLGLAVGLGIAEAMIVLFSALGVDLPEASTVIRSRTVLVAILLGTGITLLASLVPARRAMRVPPIAAVREGATVHRTRLAGRLVAPLTRVLGWPTRRAGGVAGDLASANAVRNPGRTASTAAALMVGLTLVTVVAALGAGLKATTESAVSDQLRAGYVIDGKQGVPFRASEGDRLAGVPGVTAASHVRSDTAIVQGEEAEITGIDPATIASFYRFGWSPGSEQALDRLGTDGALVTKDYAASEHLRVGGRVSLTTPAGDKRTLVVRGIYDPPPAKPLLGPVSMTQQSFDSAFTQPKNSFTFIDADAAAGAEIEAAAKGLGDAGFHTGADYPKDATKEMATLLAMLYVLLAFSVVVSLFGMVNTMVLSVFERTREIGMLRTIGMTRRQTRRMIRHESVITALIGAALGLGLGVVLAWLITQAMSKYEVAFSIPVPTLAAFTVVAVLAGIGAAVMPARRASRLNVLDALHYE
jgi:putative ABC transport system permease protein